MLNTYIIEGGIGKCVTFSAIIDALVEKNKNQIQVYTPYHEVFGGNPNVKWVFDSNTINLQQDERILNSDNVIYCEPYKTNFIKGQEHIIERYCKLADVEYNENMRPKMYTQHVREEAHKQLRDAEIDGKYMIVQFTGGQPPISTDMSKIVYNSTDAGRNYSHWLSQTVINKLKEDNPSRTIIHFGFPNEPRYENTLMLNTSFAVWHELIKGAEGFIGIDSSLSHMASSAKIKGVVIWGSTRFNQFGYSENTNVNYYMQDNWNETKFNPLDPRNSMVDPEKIVNLYKEKINENRFR